MANDASLVVQHLAFVWTCNKTDGEASPYVKFPKRQFHLRFYTGWSEDSDYRLRLRNAENPFDPVDLSVYLVIGEKTVSHCTATVTNAIDDLIWKSTKSELSKIAPDFEQKPFRFRIVLPGSAACSEEKIGHKSVQTPLYLDPKVQLEELSVDFAKLLNGDSSSPDMEIVCGDRTWKAHRSLLSCRSDVFRAMLQTDMLEGNNGRVEVPDTEAGLLEQFLQHLYTGKLPALTVDTAMRLYEMGDKYNMEGLKRQCASFLEDNLAHDNACRILSLADSHSDQKLKEIATAYVLEEKIPLLEDHWSSFCSDHPVLALAVVNRFLSSVRPALELHSGNNDKKNSMIKK